MAAPEAARKVAAGEKMILDDGICTVFAKVDVSEPGGMPEYGYKKRTQSWYGLLDFATAQDWPTDAREEKKVDARIRILQDKHINNHDVVLLKKTESVSPGESVYEVTRAYHGHDDETGELITDLTLEVVTA